MSATLKSLVSKKRRRFKKDGYDLDLTYILDNLIAMGYPGDKLEGLYRNNIGEVNKFLEARHKGHYKVYNLCEERKYNADKFKTGSVATYPFEDHNPPQMSIIPQFCRDVDEWLGKDTQNVAVVHCKAGKGRTGVMTCCYLLHSGKCQTAEAALDYYAQERTTDKKGVTIPSQKRYVRYYEYLLKLPGPEVKYKPRPVNITMIRLEGHLVEHTKMVLQFTLTTTSSDVVYTSSPFEWKACSSKKSTASTSSSSTDSHLHQPVLENSTNSAIISSCGYASNHLNIELEEPLTLVGDVKVDILSRPAKILKKSKLCHFWFNTFFVDASEHLTVRNGCNNGSSEEGSASGGAIDLSNNSGWNQKSHHDATFSGLVALPCSGFSHNSKRDSVSSENCCSIKVRFTKMDPEKLGSSHRSKQIDRTMSCPPPSDTVRPRLPVEWTSCSKEPPLKPPDGESSDLSDPVQSISPKQHYTVIFSKPELDKAHKDKKCKVFSKDFQVHLSFTDISLDQAHSLATRSSFGGGTSTFTTNSSSHQIEKKNTKMYPDHHHHSQQHDSSSTRAFVGGGVLKTTRTTSDVMAQLSSCIGVEDDDEYVFGKHQSSHGDNRHRHHRHHHHSSGGAGSCTGTDTMDGASGGGIRLNRNHSSTSSCSSTSSSSSCSENNSSCSNSSSTENCSQLMNNNNKK